MTSFVPDPIEMENLEKYSGSVYHAATITNLPAPDSPVYVEKQLWGKLNLVEKYANPEGSVLDLCCGTGEHLIYLSRFFRVGKGLDFSKPFIEKANQNKAEYGLAQIEFMEGNARQMPFETGSFDMVYCLASLYHIPRVDEVVSEISRVLKPGGYCLLDFGNLYSLNTIVCHNYPEIAHPFHISVADMKKYVAWAGMGVVERHCFQILPMWADRPWWLGPFIWQGWTRLLARQVNGRMLDEWISSLPVLRDLSFRQVLFV